MAMVEKSVPKAVTR